ncbi:hypothetical protein [Paenibacillus eucommiae]|uniref:Zf-HC2 domain-containing protein n=1 Tax=Paenibacillus eucommiae TaxID=1355755 RepID=A0ABS4IYB2_9BACL|nr:hypothetical protein [Paenibacillus eucommiae]MBP1992567.1 hypothetical protein [Paenibacillus eucommiae]
MNLCSKHDWQAYMENRLTVLESLEYEEHLYTCDACMNVYIQALEAADTEEAGSESGLVSPSLEVVDQIMAAIQATSEASIEVPTQAVAKALIQNGTQTQAGIPELIHPQQPIISGKKVRGKPSLFKRPLFQYAVAAVITLVLMSAGVFQDLSTRMSEIETFSIQNRQESFSQKLMEKTVSVLDTVQPQPKGGKSHE